MRISKFQLIGSPIAVSSQDVFLGPITLEQDSGYAIQGIWGAGLTATIKLQATIDGSDWSDITGTPVSIAGSAGSFIWNVPGAQYDEIRVYVVYGSGTGTVTAWGETKGP